MGSGSTIPWVRGIIIKATSNFSSGFRIHGELFLCEFIYCSGSGVLKCPWNWNSREDNSYCHRERTPSCSVKADSVTVSGIPKSQMTKVCAHFYLWTTIWDDSILECFIIPKTVFTSIVYFLCICGCSFFMVHTWKAGSPLTPLHEFWVFNSSSPTCNPKGATVWVLSSDLHVLS